MKRRLSTGSCCLLAGLGLLLCLVCLGFLLYPLFPSPVLLVLLLSVGCISLFWMLLLIILLRRALRGFTDELCETLDSLLAGSQEATALDRETLFARLQHRLLRLHDILEEGRAKAKREQESLQSLVSDIAHQVKTPLSNLRLIGETLQTRELTPAQTQRFLQDQRRQTDKLDFLFEAMIKTSRLESGLINLARREELLYDTLAQALSGIVYAAEEKDLTVSVDCPEQLMLLHDRRWTAEALFNLLDNAVKYTPPNGQIHVQVEMWELYCKISISDTGCGIAESAQALVFSRFHREPQAHEVPGIGIGLYLTREIISRQGGYIKLSSTPGEGACFSVFLPNT